MPSLAGVFYICDYLDITPSEFFDMDSKNPAKITALLEDMRHLDDKQLDAVATIIKCIIKK